MNKLTKLAIIGGASAYTPGLVQAIIDHSNSLPLKVIDLFDINQENLVTVSTVCHLLAKHAQVELVIHGRNRLEDALGNADIVLNSTRPGGFEARLLDETLPLEFNIPGQETVGPGGFFFALRSIPQAISLYKAMKTYCPQAILLNYTNPTNIIAQALSNMGAKNIIAMCDQSDDDLYSLAQGLSIKKPRLHFKSIGLNHASWYFDIIFNDASMKFRSDDVDIPTDLDHEHTLRFEISKELARQYENIWPNSYLSFYKKPHAFVALYKTEGSRTKHILEKLPMYYKHFSELLHTDRPVLKYHRGTKGWGDLAVRVIAALHDRVPHEVILNVPNNGVSSQFDEKTIIETNVIVSKHDMQYPQAPLLPKQELPLLHQLEEYQHETAQAAVSGDYEKTLHALCCNPFVSDMDMARRMLQRAEEEYGDLLPVFS